MNEGSPTENQLVEQEVIKSISDGITPLESMGEESIPDGINSYESMDESRIRDPFDEPNTPIVREVQLNSPDDFFNDTGLGNEELLKIISPDEPIQE